MLIAAVIAACLVIFLPRSSAFYAQLDQTADRIKTDVKDDKQRDKALEIVDKMKSAAKEGADTRKERVESLTKILQKRETTAAEITAEAKPLENADIAAAQRYLDLRFELTTVLTETEWAMVFSLPGEAPATDKTEKKDDASNSH